MKHLFVFLDIKQCTNFDLENIKMPVDAMKLEQLLKEANYPEEETQFLVEGFSQGFDIGYEGPKNRQSKANNIPFTPGVGDKVEMWNKIMKEVEEGRVAGPYESIPYPNFIQSPIGLVPKSGGKTRLIFHLSYDFKEDDLETVTKSLNGCTPREKCTVKYNDLDQAIEACIKISQETLKFSKKGVVFLGKTDLSSAFRVLPMNKNCFCWLIFKAEDPTDGKFKYFIDKCLPFGTSIRCTLYQHFSNALRHLLEHRTGKDGKAVMNYLDDFLFMAITRWICNQMIQEFISLCNYLNVPVAMEKMELVNTWVIFLGILLDGECLYISIPIEKKEKALRLLNDLADRKKATVKQLQVLTGYLNFLTKAIVPGRTFTQGIYNKFSSLVCKNGRALK